MDATSSSLEELDVLSEPEILDTSPGASQNKPLTTCCADWSVSQSDQTQSIICCINQNLVILNYLNSTSWACSVIPLKD